MIKLYDSHIVQILPGYLSGQAEVQALSYAIHRAIMRLVDFCSNIGVYAAIDTAPDDILDMLALELNTQYYDTSPGVLDIEAKRQLIKNTLVWYIRAGTPRAVEELVAAVFGEGAVEEWFDYGGQPYFFQISTDTIITPENIGMFSKMIERVKNTRSHLERINLTREYWGNVYNAGCVKTDGRMVIEEEESILKLTREYLGNVYNAGYIRTECRMVIKEEGIYGGV